MVQRMREVRNGFRERSGKTCLGFSIQSTENQENKKTRLDTRNEIRKIDLDLRHGMSHTTIL